MNTKRFWLASVTVFIVLILLGWTINTVTTPMYQSTMSLWRSSAEQAHLLPWIFLSVALFSIFFCLIFAKGFGSSGVVGGISFGFFVGLMMSCTPFSLYTYMPISLNLPALWAITGIIESIVAGIIVGIIYKP